MISWVSEFLSLFSHFPFVFPKKLPIKIGVGIFLSAGGGKMDIIALEGAGKIVSVEIFREKKTVNSCLLSNPPTTFFAKPV